MEDRGWWVAVGAALAMWILVFVVNSYVFGVERVGLYTLEFTGIFALGFGVVLRRRRAANARRLGTILVALGAVSLAISVCLLALQIAGLGRDT